MSSFSQYDLRVINRFIQQLKTEHGIQLEYQDSTLGQKLYQIVTEKDNDGLNILWDSLSLEFRAASIPSKKQPKEKGRKSYFYRGNKVESSAAENTSEQAVDGRVDIGRSYFLHSLTLSSLLSSRLPQSLKAFRQK